MQIDQTVTGSVQIIEELIETKSNQKLLTPKCIGVPALPLLCVLSAVCTQSTGLYFMHHRSLCMAPQRELDQNLCFCFTPLAYMHCTYLQSRDREEPQWTGREPLPHTLSLHRWLPSHIRGQLPNSRSGFSEIKSHPTT
jgi:hypothetical protein